MSDEQQTPDEQCADGAPGWRVVDPDGNVVDSGPLTEAQAAFLTGEASDTEGAQH